MKNNSKIIVTLFALIFVSSTVFALSPSQDPNSIEDNPDIQQERFDQDSSFFDFNFLLSTLSPRYTSSPYEVGSGKDITFQVEVEMQESRSTDSLTRIVEFYECYDSGCDDPTQDTFLEADRKPLDVSNDFMVDSGQTPNWDVIYPVPSSEGFYGAVAYMYDTDTGEVVSDDPTYEFTVGSPEDPSTSTDSTTDDTSSTDDTTTDDSTTDDTTSTDDTTTSTSPELSLYQTPSYTVDDESNTVTGTLGIQNTGDGVMPDSDIVEMQVRPAGEGPLSFVSTQQACDTAYPNNVHKEYSIDPGDSQSITLEAGTGLEDGSSYTVYFLTREDCYPDNGKTEPIYNSYNAGTFTLDDTTSSTDDTTTDDSTSTTEEPDVIEVSKPSLEYSSSTGTVSTTLQFKNQGGSMTDNNIVEMQVRPEGEVPLAFSSTQEVCDENYPENVHKEFLLESGETASTTLSTDVVSEPGTYDVYVLTRNGCYPDNDRVDPYPNSKKAGQVTIEAGTDGNRTAGFGSVQPASGGLPLLPIGLFAVLVSLGVYGVFLRG